MGAEPAERLDDVRLQQRQGARERHLQHRPKCLQFVAIVGQQARKLQRVLWTKPGDLVGHPVEVGGCSEAAAAFKDQSVHRIDA